MRQVGVEYTNANSYAAPRDDFKGVMMRLLRDITTISLLLISIQANAVLITAGDAVRVDFQAGDWMGGTGDPDLQTIGPRIGFCGTLAGGTGTFSGDAGCDYNPNAGGDLFRISIFSATDVLLFSQLDPANGSVSPNTWQNNISLGGTDVFPRDGYVLFELVAGALDFNEILLIGVEDTAPNFIIGTSSLSFLVISGNAGGGGSTTVPEPGTVGLLVVGLLGTGLMRRRRAA